MNLYSRLQNASPSQQQPIRAKYQSGKKPKERKVSPHCRTANGSKLSPYHLTGSITSARIFQCLRAILVNRDDDHCLMWRKWKFMCFCFRRTPFSEEERSGSLSENMFPYNEGLVSSPRGRAKFKMDLMIHVASRWEQFFNKYIDM